jgi:hypothetical protein
LFCDFSDSIAELFDGTDSLCNLDQPFALLRMLFHFGPHQTATIEVFPAEITLEETLEKSKVQDKGQWRKNKKRITRLLADNNLASRAKKKKKMTTTYLDAYQRLCKQLFPAKVLLGHKLVDVLAKEDYQKKRNMQADRGYRYSWNQKAIEQVCKMVESSRR